MSATMQSQAESGAAPEAAAPVTAASFGTAFVGFMLTTTLATSLMVLLSQGG
jgi:hypothetical protein